MPVYQFHVKQKLNASVEEVWDFISSPKNLKQITPDYMGFDIVSKNMFEKMYPGMIVSYKVSPLLGIKMNWTSEITQIIDHVMFIDEQRVGPYKMWHHEHWIKSTDDGLEMTDLVTYQPPFGFLGSLANTLIIKRRLKEIFDYRKKSFEEFFPDISKK